MLAGDCGIGGRGGEQGLALAQEVAQDAIDQAAEGTAGDFTGSDDGLVDHRVRRFRTRLQAMERDQQERAHLDRLQRRLQQTPEDEIAPAVAAQRTVGRILSRRSRHRRRRGQSRQAGVQTASLEYGCDRLRREQQAQRERVGGQAGTGKHPCLGGGRRARRSAVSGTGRAHHTPAQRRRRLAGGSRSSACRRGLCSDRIGGRGLAGRP